MRVVAVLRANSWAAHRRLIPQGVANLVATILWSRFTCSLTRKHVVVAKMPVCWRCPAEWRTWSDVPERSRR